jgi:hypothetical protein
MDGSWVPPYFGSWEDLVGAALGGAQAGGSPGGGPGWPPSALPLMAPWGSLFEPTPVPWRMVPGPLPWQMPWRMGPRPVPWRLGPLPDPWLPSVRFLVSLTSQKEAASRAGQGGEEWTRVLDQATLRFIDDYCGTGVRPVPWPWPGPRPWVLPVVSELTLIANGLAEGSLRNNLQGIADQMMERAFQTG